MTAPNGTWSWPTPTRFGPGRVTEIAAACREIGLAKPLVIRDPGLDDLRDLNRALDQLADAARFTDVRGNPTEHTVMDAVATYLTHRCDGIVAIGGGSALDTGKAVALLARQTASPWAFVHGKPLPPDAAPVAPVIAVPTTAGTGSEYSATAVIIETAARAKRSLWHPDLLPKRVILDPKLTVTLPRTLTTWTGLDALSHNIEAYLSPGYHPIADAVALSGIRRIAENLPRVLVQPDDLVARAEMLTASAMGAAAFDKGLGAVHALSHAVTASSDTHHGLTNAVLLPYVLAYQAEVAAQRMTDIGRALGLDPATPDGLVTWSTRFNEHLEIPGDLRGLGVGDLPPERLAATAVQDANAPGSPRPLSHESAADLLSKAMRGRT
jgi:alcohol dehydrogenase class IV